MFSTSQISELITSIKGRGEIPLKFTEWLFAKVLAEVGFRIELLTTSSEKGYSLVMCQPQRFNI